jgi:hypothetical protein
VAHHLLEELAQVQRAYPMAVRVAAAVRVEPVQPLQETMADLVVLVFTVQSPAHRFVTAAVVVVPATVACMPLTLRTRAVVEMQDLVRVEIAGVPTSVVAVAVVPPMERILETQARAVTLAVATAVTALSTFVI